MKENLDIVPEKPVRTEILIVKDNKGQERFKSNTRKTMCFSKCFSTSYSVLNQFSQWKQAIDRHTKRAFPKMRLGTKQLKKSAANNLNTKRNKLQMTISHRKVRYVLPRRDVCRRLIAKYLHIHNPNQNLKKV